MRWCDEYAPSCEPCRIIHGRKGEESPCEGCRVDPLPENEETARLFMAVRNQFIVLGKKIVDLNFSAVKAVMDIYGITDKTCFDRTVMLWRKMMGERNEE